MWCKNCNIETNDLVCPICGMKTAEDLPVEIYWCDNCEIPIINTQNQADKGVCPICSHNTRYLTSDLRPVFPEERLLLALLLGKEPGFYMDSSVWSADSRYYIDGKKPITLGTKMLAEVDADAIARSIQENQEAIKYTSFEANVETFIEANRQRLNYLKDEAFEFVKNAASKYPEENIVISFSGGKDSTVTADLATKALSNPSLVHIFGNTTLEFPLTVAYAERFRDTHPLAIFQIAKNEDQVFYDVCEDIGPPARLMRWCCSMFKTGPITRVINSMYRSQRILTFYGIRKSESVSRSKYNRIEDDAESVKIQQQTVASPIFFWKDIDIWLYILSEKIDFNEAYRLGYDRVGCWCCPNNNIRAQFLSRIYMPDQSKKWRDFLIRFAQKIGKPDPEVYVDTGKWKARQGGNGLAASNDIKIRFTNCTTEDHAKIYLLNRPYDLGNDEKLRNFIPTNEAINKEIITSMAEASRNKLIAALLRNELEPNLGLTGTGQEVSIMRSTLIRTGIWTVQNGIPELNLYPTDANMRNMLSVIEQFIEEVGHDGKQSFGVLYNRLMAPNFHIGLRKGVIPLYLAVVLHKHRQQIIILDHSGQIPVFLCWKRI